MEKNQFEEIEEVEKIEKVEETSSLELKEYEKLLKAEENRKYIEKAQTLINYGCFEQKEVTTFDFSDYEYIESKKFKDRYNLYISKEGNSLVYVCPLIENNEDDPNAPKSVKPYAFDCIYIEDMDDETYKAVVQAGKNNVATWPQKLIKTGWIAYIAYVAISIFVLLYYIVYSVDSAIDNKEDNLVTPVIASIKECGALVAGIVIALPLLILATLKYKDYKNNKLF